MLRALAPYLFATLVIAMAAGVAYAKGAPVWVPYAAIVVCTLVVLPGYERWDREQHPR